MRRGTALPGVPAARRAKPVNVPRGEGDCMTDDFKRTGLAADLTCATVLEGVAGSQA